jgi:membrane glycosyltransferase
MAAMPDYFAPAQRSLFPLWPVYDFAAARTLCLLAMGMLFGPRLLAALLELAAMLRRGEVRPRQVPTFLASVLAEWALGTLLSPALMLFQAVFVLASLTGERVPWTAQRREEREVGLGESLTWHWLHIVVALGLTLGSVLVSVQALVWTLPLILPLLGSPFLTMLTASPGLGRLMSRFGLLHVPEDSSRDEALTVFDGPTAEVGSAVATLEDRTECAWHALSVVGSGLLQRVPATRREELRGLLSGGEPVANAEAHACLTDVELLLEALTPKRDPAPGVG